MSLLINRCYQFTDFIIDLDQKVLLRSGKPLALTPKVFDTLLILVENGGRIVEKVELMRRLWPDTFVEEANLTFNIQQLRKWLGDNARSPFYIETVQRRGYRFIAPLEEVGGDNIPTGRNGDSETSRGRPLDIGAGMIELIEPEESEQPIELADRQTAMNEKNLDAIAVSHAVGLRKRKVGFRFVMVMALAGLGLTIWMSSNAVNRKLSEKNNASARSAVAPPIKLESLTATGQSGSVAISPDGRFIAYTRISEKKTSLWLRQLSTNTNVEISPASLGIYGLAFANNGDFLFFARRDERTGCPLLYRTALYRVSLLGGVPAKLVETLEGNFAISADDTRIAFIRQAINHDGQREYSLMIANVDGTGERTVLVGTHPNDLDVPVWSSDERSIICSYGSSTGGGQTVSLVEISIADGTKKELSSQKFFHIAKLAWLADKNGLIMSARKSLGENNQLWRVSYPAMEMSQITEGLIHYRDLSITASGDKAAASQTTIISDVWVGPGREPKYLKRITQAIDICWTPTGQLVYSSTASGNKDIWIMQGDGAAPTQLTVDPEVDSRPRVAPDNRYIVFVSTRTGSSQIWRMALDGSDQVQLTSGSGKEYPSISPDGQWVLYNTTDDWHLWKIPIGGGEPVRLTDYPAAYPAVSPDGKMIACLGRNQTKGTRTIMILAFEGGRLLKRNGFPRVNFCGTRMHWASDSRALIYAVEADGPPIIIKDFWETGITEKIATFDEDELFDFDYSVDGQFLAVTRGRWQHDIVLIRDFSR